MAASPSHAETHPSFPRCNRWPPPEPVKSSSKLHPTDGEAYLTTQMSNLFLIIDYHDLSVEHLFQPVSRLLYHTVRLPKSRRGLHPALTGFGGEIGTRRESCSLLTPAAASQAKSLLPADESMNASRCSGIGLGQPLPIACVIHVLTPPGVAHLA